MAGCEIAKAKRYNKKVVSYSNRDGKKCRG